MELIKQLYSTNSGLQFSLPREGARSGHPRGVSSFANSSILNIPLFIQKLINHLLLNLAYFFGIGFSSLLGKLFGKKFLNLMPQKSNWIKYQKSVDLEKMY